MPKEKRVLIAGGGTGGHLFPAIAIGNMLKENGIKIQYIGSKYGIEAKILSEKGETPILLNIKGFYRTLSLSTILDNLIFPFRLIIAYIKSRSTIKSFNPQVVVGTGGYSSGLPLLAAIHMNYKTLIQEQNTNPGFTTQKLAPKVNTICIGFKESAKFFKKKTLFTGNPIRKDLFIMDKNNQIKKSNLKSNRFTIFILGGSQGSKPINSHILQNISFYNKLDALVLWQCGKKDYNFIKSQELGENIQIFDFINDIGKIYSKSNIVISRSGALTVSEITACGKASILIPFPHAANNHQYYNAKVLTNVGASILIPQIDLAHGTLEETLSMLILNPDKIKIMQKAALSIAKPNATNDIVNEINNLISV